MSAPLRSWPAPSPSARKHGPDADSCGGAAANEAAPCTGGSALLRVLHHCPLPLPPPPISPAHFMYLYAPFRTSPFRVPIF